MLNNIPEEWVGFRVCKNCGEIMSEGFFLNGDYACCDECGIALYGGDEEAFHRDLEEEENFIGSTDCFYTEWYDEVDHGEAKKELGYDTNIGYRLCANCGKRINEGFNLDGECACSWECAVALYGYDAEMLQKDLDEERQHPDSTGCKWMKWDVRYDGMILRSCYRIIRQWYRSASSGYKQEARYFTRKQAAEREYDLLWRDIDTNKEEWISLELVEFIERGFELQDSRRTILRFCGNWRKYKLDEKTKHNVTD